jgi:hypothetical protein
MIDRSSGSGVLTQLQNTEYNFSSKVGGSAA